MKKLAIPEDKTATCFPAKLIACSIPVSHCFLPSNWNGYINGKVEVSKVVIGQSSCDTQSLESRQRETVAKITI
ncbi:hypothetical protein QQG55_9825 [Brugia pahangi]